VRGRAAIVVALALAAAGSTWGALDQARAEPNLEKRSKLALDNAGEALKAARDAYRAGDTAGAQAKAGEIEESVDLAYQSLVETGKNPRQRPKYFKQAEMETRELGRKLDDLQREMSYTDRPAFDKAKAKIQQVHDDLLRGLMEGKKRR
jgi:hypothetical protein